MTDTILVVLILILLSLTTAFTQDSYHIKTVAAIESNGCESHQHIESRQVNNADLYNLRSFEP